MITLICLRDADLAAVLKLAKGFDLTLYETIHGQVNDPLLNAPSATARTLLIRDEGDALPLRMAVFDSTEAADRAWTQLQVEYHVESLEYPV